MLEPYLVVPLLIATVVPLLVQWTVPRPLYPVDTPGFAFSLASGLPVVRPKHRDFENIVHASTATVEVLADGFAWAEGPVWIPHNHSGLVGGFLLFSDVKRNAIYKWDDVTGLSLFLVNSGHDDSSAVVHWVESGSNGLVLDPEQALLYVMEHGNRQVSVLDLTTHEKRAILTHYKGKRFHSPNDGAFRPGTRELYFTDAPYGFRQFNRSDDLETHPNAELSHSGVYRVNVDDPRTLQLVIADVPRANGVAFSPKGDILYISNPRGWRSYRVDNDQLQPIGPFGVDAPSEGPGSQDGLTVDSKGRVFATGKDGVHVFSAAGQLLGSIHTEMRTGNICFGADGDVYILADRLLLRMRSFTGPPSI